MSASPGDDTRRAAPRSTAPADDATTPLSPSQWEGILAHELACPVRVVYTRARRTPIQVKRLSVARRGSPAALEVRMHAMFAGAPHDVHRAVASWIRSGRRAPRACAALDAWIAQGLEALPREPPPPPSRARGHHHDLLRLVHELHASDFASEFPRVEDLPAITWGRRGPSRTRSSLRLGSFDPDPRLVRIHAVLDQPTVPDWFVRFVVFHELLHAVHPPVRGEDDRWVHHGREFRRRERAYRDYARAIAWEKLNLRALIRAARHGTAFVPVGSAAREEAPRPTSGRAASTVAARTVVKTPADAPPKRRGFWQRLLFPGA